ALTQTHKIPRVPIVLVGSDFWNGMDDFIKRVVLDRYKAISPDDIDLYKIIDDDEAIVKYIASFAKNAKQKE
ncbi:TIGR00730 family Rossman fold protein, partial [Candidatus Saccharibacteria bacterium 32-49-10]